MLEKTSFTVYLDAIDPRDPEWLRDRIIGQAANDPHISGLELKELYDAVYKAMEITQLLPDGELKCDLIRYVYWGKTQRRVEDAPLVLPISRRTAIRWHGDFVRLVGKCYGFEVGTYEPKICAKMVE